MGKIISNYKELPLPNKKVYDLVQQETDGNVSLFSDNIGVQQQSLDRIFKTDSRSGKYPSVSDAIKDAIKSKYGFKDDWFYKDEESGGVACVGSHKTLPRIPYDAAAGTLTDTIDGVTEYECEQIPVICIFPKYDFTIRITGRSMEPEYLAGDEVACLRINQCEFIQWGRVHVLDTTQGVVIKRIYDKGDSILCRSYNPEFPDFTVAKKDIRSFNLVVGSLRL